MNVLELFVGAGGLALGLSKAGFRHEALVELDPEACATIRENSGRGVEHVRDWQLYPGDVHDVVYTGIRGTIDLLAAGAPCQPFSFGGKGRGQLDKRNMFPEVLRAVLELSPKAVLIENVKGLTAPRFRGYLDYILRRLEHPDVPPNEGESWDAHLQRLNTLHENRPSAATYRATYRVLNAADFGAPQWRERVFIVAFRSDLGVEWIPPAPTHELDALLVDQWFTGEYWRRHGLPARKPYMTKRYRDRLRQLREEMAKVPGVCSPRLPAWRTVRDAISDLPRIRVGGEATDIANHFLNPGARAYAKHSGSPYDEPAKTLKAGGHGVPGGENMLNRGKGRVRYFSVRECARLQTFPDDYVFSGAWTRCMRQLGNAVPVVLAKAVAESVRAQLEHASSARALQPTGT